MNGHEAAGSGTPWRREASMRRALLPRGSRCFRIIILVLLLIPAGHTAALTLAPQDPNRVKAAFLRNFAHYVTWPANAFPNARSPWRIGVLGKDPFGKVLENTLEGRTEQGRGFEVHRAETLGRLPECQIVYVAYGDPAARRAALVELQDKPVLTVGDAPGFLQEGGIIRFQVADRVEMSVNLDQARSVSLQIQTKMLEVTKEIVEDGSVRKR